MWFKLAFGAVFLSATVVAGTTARAAGKCHGGSLNQLSHEIPALVAARAALGVVFYGALGMWFFLPAAVPWAYLDIPTWVRWLTVVLLIPGLIFFGWAFRSLGTNYRGGVGLYPEHSLVTTGAYAHLRHPIYLAFIALMVLMLPLSANWVLALSGLLLVSSIAVVRIPVEEKQLEERFGESWRSYRDRTRALLPRSRPPRTTVL